jgi:hypothetical protein
MTKVKRERQRSHRIDRIEVLREIWLLKSTERRLHGIAAGLGVAEGITRPGWSALRNVLHDSVVAEAKSVSEIAGRLNGLLGPDAAKLEETA